MIRPCWLLVAMVLITSGCRTADYHQLQVTAIEFDALTFSGGSTEITADVRTDDPADVDATIRIEDEQGELVDSGDMTTNDDGTFRFTTSDLPANPDLNDVDRRFTIIIEATDSEGRTSIEREALVIPAIERPPAPPVL